MEITCDQNRIGKNIKALRKAYGLTQAKLAEILSRDEESTIEERTIRKYENGELGIKDTLKKRIAIFFGVSMQELMYRDLSQYTLHDSKEQLNAALEHVDDYFPIFESEAALENMSFQNAYTHHKALIKALKQSMDGILKGKRDIISCMNNMKDYMLNLHLYLDYYNDAYNIDSIKFESSANYIALFHLIAAVKLTIPDILYSTARLDRVKKQMPSMENIMDEVSQEVSGLSENLLLEMLANVFPFLSDEYFDSKHKDLLDNMMITLKQDQHYSDLYEYYVAMEYLNNIESDPDDANSNKRTGLDMLKRLARRKNIYAERFLKYNPDPLEIIDK